MRKDYTLGEWLETWLEYYVEPSALAPSTKACYNRAVRSVPASLGSIWVIDIAPLDCLCWIQSVARTHPRAAQLDRVMLSRALLVARKLHLTDFVLDEDTCPQVVHHAQKAVVLTLPELLRYMDAAALMDSATVLLLCCCGLRRGEALAASRADLSADGILTVQHQRGDSRELHPLKSKHSYRRIALPDNVLDCIRMRPLTLSGLFYEGSMHKVYTDRHSVTQRLSLPPVTLHGLRHSVATAAVLGGEPVKLVQGCLGHASFALTADLYADHLPDTSAVCKHLFV